jgi:ATP-dependent exoDNAse (exonuclease V) alpha subunit
MPRIPAKEIIGACLLAEQSSRGVLALRALVGPQQCLFVEAADADQGARAIVAMIRALLPALEHQRTDAQVLSPGHQGPLGVRTLNQLLRPVLNPQQCTERQTTTTTTRTSGGHHSHSHCDTAGQTMMSTPDQNLPNASHSHSTVHSSSAALGDEEVESGGGQATMVSQLPWGLGDKVIQTQNNYDKAVFNGDIGFVRELHHSKRDTHCELPSVESAVVEYPDGRGTRLVRYAGMRQELSQLAAAWAVTVHKAQGSEYPVVFVPLTMHHAFLLSRNLLYTAATRAQALCVLVGEPRALHVALSRQQGGPSMRGHGRGERCTGLAATLRQLASAGEQD